MPPTFTNHDVDADLLKISPYEISLRFTTQGTACVLQNKHGDVLDVAIAKLNSGAVPTPTIGGRYAMGRALVSYGEHLLHQANKMHAVRHGN